MPTLPKYPIYKPSGIDWIGDIPEGWSVVKFKYIFNTKKGILPKSILPENNSNSNLPPYLSMDYLRSGEVSQWVFDENSKIIEEGETLLLWDGSNAGEFIKSRRGVLSSTLALIELRAKIDQKFAWYYCKMLEIELKKQTIGMGIPHVSGGYLQSLAIFVPKEETTQTQIANYLDEKTGKIDDLIAKKTQMINLLKEERQAIINQAVTKGIDPNAKMKHSGIDWIGEIPEGWSVKKLKYLVSINSETLPETTNTDYKFNYIDIGNVDYFNGVSKLQELVFSQAPSRARRVVKYGNTLVSTVRTYLRAIAFVENQDADLIGSTGFAVLSGEKNFNNKYLYYLISSEKIIDTICSISTGVSYPAVNSTDIGNIKVWLPKSLEEQTQIVQFIEQKTTKIDETIAKIEKEIQLLQEYRTALISEVVTGKVRVG